MSTFDTTTDTLYTVSLQDYPALTTNDRMKAETRFAGWNACWAARRAWHVPMGPGVRRQRLTGRMLTPKTGAWLCAGQTPWTAPGVMACAAWASATLRSSRCALVELTWPGRTLLRTADTPAHVCDGDRNTWDHAATLPLEPFHYYTTAAGDQVSVHWKQTGEVVFSCQAPLTLVPCPVPF